MTDKPQVIRQTSRVIPIRHRNDRISLVTRPIQVLGLVLALFGTQATPTIADEPTNSAESNQPLNVLFIVSDDLRPELGCYGNSVIKTPNIDDLAKHGLVFERAYCQQAVCSPSRSSVMTGTRPDTTKVWDLRTHFRKALPDVVTLPQHFKQNGYSTQGIGKIYHSGLDDEPSWSLKTPKRKRRRSSTAKKPAPKKNEPSTPATSAALPLTKTDRGPAFSMTDDSPNGGSDGAVADQAIEALRQFKTNSKPFFLGVGFHKPHLPFSVPKMYWDMYDPAKIPMAPNRHLPKDAPAFSLVDKAEVWNYSGVPDVPHFPDDYARQMKHGYYAAVSYMDAQLGRMIQELDALDMRKNTIIVLWGDHGWKLGEHDRWAKHSNVEDDARAPLIVAAPGMQSIGKKTAALVEFVDIYPTLADLAAIPLPKHLEGTSFKPLLDKPQLAWKSAAFSQYPRTHNRQKMMGYSLRTDRYRFTRWVHRDDHSKVAAIELYDHTTDPQENTNIAGLKDNNDVIARLGQQLSQGWKSARPANTGITTPSRPVSLFNGSDLTGWHVDVPQRDNNPDATTTFIVRDNNLVSLGQPQGHLITKKRYANYRLDVEYRFAGKPGNCGVLVHASTPRSLYKMFPKSIEVQMNHQHAGDFWCIVEDITVEDMIKRRGPKQKWGVTEGKARRILNLTDGSEKPVGEWNSMTIECVDNSVKAWVNGDLVNHGTKCTASSGQVALQAEGSEVEFRKLLLTPITELTP